MTASIVTCEQGIDNLASFPGHSHLQYLIACSMQIWRGKAWEIWSHAMTSGRQRVDTWGATPNKPFLVKPGPRQHQCSLFTTPGTGQCETGILTVRHQPLCVSTLCLPDVTTRDQISQAFLLYISTLQRLEVGRAMEQGY